MLLSAFKYISHFHHIDLHYHQMNKLNSHDISNTMARVCFVLFVILYRGCIGQHDEGLIDGTDSIFAFIGDKITVQCRHRSETDGTPKSSVDQLQISIVSVTSSKRHGYIPTTLETSALSSSPSSAFVNNSNNKDANDNNDVSNSDDNDDDHDSNHNAYLVVSGVVNVTEDLIGTNEIVCETSRNVTIQRTLLYVQGHISNISNITAMWNYPSRTLNVSWAWEWHNVKSFMNVDVKWNVDNPVSSSGGLLCNQQRHTFCIINDDLKVANVIHFRVSVNVKETLAVNYHDKEQNTADEWTNSYFHRVFNFSVSLNETVKTGRPEQVTVKWKSSHCLNISWVNPAFFRDFKAVASYSVQVEEILKGGVIFTPQLTKLTSNAMDAMTASVCGLDPGTSYVFALRVKSTDSVYWSDPSFNVYGRTLESKPNRGPEVTSNSYWSGPCEFGRREIIVYWKDVPQKIANGDLKDFVVMFNSVELKARPYSNCANAKLSCYKDYLVKIYSATRVGLTDSPSTLVIPSLDKEIKTPSGFDFQITKVKVTTELTLKVTWACRQPITCNNHFVDIYYCRGETFSKNSCIDDIQHRRIPLQMETFVLRNVPEQTNRFGFALSDDGQKVHGIIWTDCVFDINKKPSMPSGVIAFRGDNPTTIVVKWNSPSCTESDGVAIISYDVVCCRNHSLDGKGSCRTISVVGSASSTTISGVDEDGMYAITVVAESRAGKSTSSPYITLTPAQRNVSTDTLSPDSLPLRNILIIIGIIVLVVISGILVLLIRKVRQRMALMRSELTAFSQVNSKDLVEESGICTSNEPT